MRHVAAPCYAATTAEGTRKMRVAIVKAAHDDEAGVWSVEPSDIEGLRLT